MKRGYNVSHTLVSGDCQLINQETEDKSQVAVNHLYLVCPEYIMVISVPKTRETAFRSAEPVRSKIIVDNIWLLLVTIIIIDNYWISHLSNLDSGIFVNHVDI